MPSALTSLFWISLVAVLAPLLAGLAPRRLVPEVVLLLVLGVVIGPFGWQLAADGEAIDMLRELGLAMLFLLAGYEIEPRELTGRAGRSALATWITCLGLAFVLTVLLDVAGVLTNEVAVSIALTSTALGTLLPMLKDNDLLRTAVGAAVLRHGAYGELGPIVAIAVLLGSRGPLASLVVLLAFGAVAVLLSLPSRRISRETSRLLMLIRRGSETTGQTTVRLTLLLLVTLIAVASAFDLDIVLAAFAAGFILRLALPGGDDRLETKLNGIAFGLLVPVFFVTSGMAIDPRAIADNPLAFVFILVAILACRGLPVFLVTRFRGSADDHRLGTSDSLGVGLFAATGLPIIVAVTSVSVSAGEMSTENASVLVGAGAATVLLCPLLATLVLSRAHSPVRRPSPH
jgi:Kef-type K+ transport system membrane component KefB